LQDKISKDKEKRIQEIKKEIDKDIDRINKTNNESMIDIYENKIISLQEEISEISSQLNNVDPTNGVAIDKLITNTKAILRNPAMIWEL
jgi:DNA anti-recombination protein RmuC